MVCRSWGCCCLYLSQLETGVITWSYMRESLPKPNSCIVVFPMTIAPASSHFLTHQDVPSNPFLKSILVPSVRSYPSTCTSSLTTTGTPSSGPTGFPFLYRAAEASAAARIASTRESRNATECLPGGCASRRIRGSSVSTTFTGVNSADLYSAW